MSAAGASAAGLDALAALHCAAGAPRLSPAELAAHVAALPG